MIFRAVRRLRKAENYFSLLYGMPRDFGARDNPMKPANTIIVKTYGMIWTNWTGIGSPEDVLMLASGIVKASVKPKNRHAIKTCTGRHFAKIRAASAMNPRPAVIPRVNKDDCTIDKYAPPAAARTPD